MEHFLSTLLKSGLMGIRTKGSEIQGVGEEPTSLRGVARHVGVVPSRHLVVVLWRLGQLIQVVKVERGRIGSAYHIHCVHGAIVGAPSPVVRTYLQTLHGVYWYLRGPLFTELVDWCTYLAGSLFLRDCCERYRGPGHTYHHSPGLDQACPAMGYSATNIQTHSSNISYWFLHCIGLVYPHLHSAQHKSPFPLFLWQFPLFSNSQPLDKTVMTAFTTKQCDTNQPTLNIESDLYKDGYNILLPYDGPVVGLACQNVQRTHCTLHNLLHSHPISVRTRLLAAATCHRGSLLDNAKNNKCCKLL
uniref:(California timema) hypothetical protein n=1 Tax=Timema californicum TaxID=61474 RepID=A0A7R9JA17_TIMCA|nr:unnamed protein product [Timema californicum]